MGGDFEGDIFDRGSYASSADVGLVFGEDGEFCDGDDVGVAWLGCGQVAAAFWVLMNISVVSYRIILRNSR